MTHLFNAMPPIHHREPGVIGAACEREHVTAELICDGLHLHPSAVRMAFKLFRGRICLISDALRCCGMPDGEYELGGQKVTLKAGTKLSLYRTDGDEILDVKDADGNIYRLTITAGGYIGGSSVTDVLDVVTE